MGRALGSRRTWQVGAIGFGHFPGIIAQRPAAIGPGLCNGDGSIQHFPTADSESSIAVKANLWRSAPPYSLSSSDCLPDALEQVLDIPIIAATVRESVRVLE
jgi:hypothetical protein